MRADVCKFYKGAMLTSNNSECDAGVDPVALFCGGDTAGWVKKVPCFQKNENAPECSERKFPTDKEVRESLGRMRKNMENVMKVVALIPSKGGQGQVECPKCNGIVDWTRARSNGHRHARCRTKDCLFFME